MLRRSCYNINNNTVVATTAASSRRCLMATTMMMSLPSSSVRNNSSTSTTSSCGFLRSFTNQKQNFSKMMIPSGSLLSTKRFCSSSSSDSSKEAASPPPIKVLWSTTPNTESMRFYSMELSFLPPGSTLDLPNEGHSYKSPLAEMLWKQCPDIASLYFSDEYITVTKQVSSSWDDLTPLVKECIVEFAHSGLNILSDEGEQELESGHPDTEPQPDDSEVLLAIKELLATRIRPMLAMDGGGMKFIAFEDGLVYLVLEGACKTCSSKGNTLKVGIERMLMHWIPEVAEVVEVDELWAEDYKRQFAEEKKKLEEEQQQQQGGKVTKEQTQEEREAAAAPVNGAK